MKRTTDFSADTMHAQCHSTFTQQVMQMLSVQANSYNFSEGKTNIWLTRPANGKFHCISGMLQFGVPVQKYYGETGKVGRSAYTVIVKKTVFVRAEGLFQMSSIPLSRGLI